MILIDPLTTLDTMPRFWISLPSHSPKVFPQSKSTKVSSTLVSARLTAAVTPDCAALHLLQLALEVLDRGVRALQVLVEPVTLADELLLPLAETVLLDLDLLGKSLSQALFLFLELWVVQLSWAGLAELSGLHLLGSVCLVVRLLGGVNEIQHVCADQDRAKLLEVAVLLVLDLSNTPGVLATLDNASITSFNILLGTNNGEWHSGHKAACVLGGWFIVLLNWWRVDLDALGLDHGANLRIVSVRNVGHNVYQYSLSA